MKKLVPIISLLFLAMAVHGQYRFEVTHIDSTLNTAGSESSVIIVDDSVLLYTSMKTDESSQFYLLEFGQVVTKLFQAPIAHDGTIGNGSPCMWGLNMPSKNCGHATYDRTADIIYFTQESGGRNRVTQIYYSQRKNRYWGKPQLLGGNVNVPGYNSTHPCVSRLPNGQVVLYYTSDRPGGMGGYDIWYTTLLKPTQPSNSINLGMPVNSDSNDVSPFYDGESSLLFFSSNRAGGLGGYDIYCAQGQRNAWQPPFNMGEGLNSTENDLFFYIQPCQCRCDTAGVAPGDSLLACGFLTSNRGDSYYATEANCCNDIFRWRMFGKTMLPAPTPPPAEPPALQPSDLLPLALYFDNDQPDPRSLATSASVNYSNSWRQYTQQYDLYMGSLPSSADWHKRDSVRKEMAQFFERKVMPCHSRLLQFFDLMLRDLEAGYSVTLTVEGYASPLFESQYNVNLALRRIDCFVREMKGWKDSVLLPYLNMGRLQVIPSAQGSATFSEVKADDPLRDPKNVRSVFSVPAADSRKITVIDYQKER